ncbi:MULTISPECIES: copper resistance system multicopper oxidase [Henriciella]|uniref:copper resistance system multicopper oxidase n=1 Tax=Henriciella TaxID=453849 RepID=UPI003514DE67
MINRRHLLQSALSAGAALGSASLLPAWAKSASDGNLGLPALSGTQFDLNIGHFPVRIDGKAGMATGINGTLPGPLLRLREGDDVTLNVRNGLEEDTSIHWHGLLVPFHMDGVPGVSFPGIKPGETFKYQFKVPQNGTYWYHSHSGLQEQLGHYGPIVIDPAGQDPVTYDREYVLVLSDWSFTHPHRIFAKLKKNAESLNFNRPTISQPTGLGGMWGQMRMSPRDLADVTGETYTYLINGQSTADNFNMVFRPGERVRLRIINASAMTLFNVRLPDLPMTVVQADGLNVQPVETDEFQIGVAETYDVIVEPTEERPYALVAESIDRSGQVVATLGPRAGMKAQAPELRAVPMLTMRDMGMAHGDMTGMSSMPSMAGMKGMNHESAPDMAEPMTGHDMGGMPMRPDPDGPAVQPVRIEADIERGPGVAKVSGMATSRLNEPGIGLDDVPHRALTYSQLRSLDMNTDHRAPEREIVVHLTSNMERYMWSFDGVKFSEVTEAIKFYEGERVRLTLINDTMMPHPIHLHGMFFDLVNGGGMHMPRKHTVTVKPADKVSVDITAEHVGDWAFHCHLLYHMHAGMMQVVSVLPTTHPEHPGRPASEPAMDMPMDHHGMNHGEHKS